MLLSWCATKPDSTAELVQICDPKAKAVQSEAVPPQHEGQYLHLILQRLDDLLASQQRLEDGDKRIEQALQNSVTRSAGGVETIRSAAGVSHHERPRPFSSGPTYDLYKEADGQSLVDAPSRRIDSRLVEAVVSVQEESQVLPVSWDSVPSVPLITASSTPATVRLVDIENSCSIARPILSSPHTSCSITRPILSSPTSRPIGQSTQTFMLPVSWPASVRMRSELNKRESSLEDLLTQSGTTCESCISVLEDWEGKDSKSCEFGAVFTSVKSLGVTSRGITSLGGSQLQLPKRSAFVLVPSSLYCLALDWFSLAALCFDVWATPFILAWEIDVKPLSWLHIVFWATCIFWTVDIVLNFRIGFYSHGDLEMRSSLIARHYLKTWFLPDVMIVLGDWVSLLVLPLCSSVNMETVKLLRLSKFSRMLRLLGVMRVAKLTTLFERVFDVRASEYAEMLVQIPVLLLVVLWVNHIICCTWFAIGRLDGFGDTGMHWLDDRVARDSKVTYANSGSGYQYATAFHWALTQMTPGSMSVTARNTGERWYNNFCLILGVVFFGALLSMITSRMTQLNLLREHKSNSLLTLRHFLLQGEFPKQLRMRVLKQIVNRMAKTKLLTMKDVSALSLLSLSLKAELQYELCKPVLTTSHPFFFMVDKISSKILHDLCNDAVTAVVLSVGDNLFLPATDAESAYLVKRGRLLYIQEPCTSKVRKRYAVRVEPLQWLSEMALWTQWTHVGTVEVKSPSEILVVHAESLIKSFKRHGLIWQLTREYAELFHKRLISAHAGSECFPSDSQRPFLDFTELFFSMSKNVKVLIGLLTIQLMQKSPWFSMLHRGVLLDLKEQVQAGTCTLGLDGGNEVVRVVAVTALRLYDAEKRRIYVHLGQIREGTASARCQLPGSKQRADETSSEAIARVVSDKMERFGAVIDILSSDLEVALKESESFSISTKYLRTVYKAAIKENATIPESNSQAKFCNMPTRHSRTSTCPDLPEYAEVAFDSSGDTIYVGAWIPESSFESLVSASGQKALNSWIKYLPYPGNAVYEQSRQTTRSWRRPSFKTSLSSRWSK